MGDFLSQAHVMDFINGMKSNVINSINNNPNMLMLGDQNFWVKLWENANISYLYSSTNPRPMITSSFESSQITLSTEPFPALPIKGIMIGAIEQANNVDCKVMQYLYIPKNTLFSTENVPCSCYSIDKNGNHANFRSRSFVFNANNNQLQVDTGYKTTVSNKTFSQQEDNSVLVPAVIYGLLSLNFNE